MSKVVLILIVIVLLVIAAVVLWMVLAPSSNNSQSSSSSNSASSNSTSSNNFTVQGVQVAIERQGTGSGAVSGNTLTVNYIGTLQNGTKFDSSYDRNRAFSFQLGQGSVIKGWDVGLVGMKVGEKRKLTIPADMGYGVKGFIGAGIPSNATLVFEVELLNIAH